MNGVDVVHTHTHCVCLSRRTLILSPIPDGIHVQSPPAIQCHRMPLMEMRPWVLQTETSARDRRNCCGCFHGEIFPTEAPKRLAARTRCSRPAVLEVVRYMHTDPPKCHLVSDRPWRAPSLRAFSSASIDWSRASTDRRGWNLDCHPPMLMLPGPALRCLTLPC